MSQTQWREPIELPAGDTLAFSKKAGDYSAHDGWSLVYELRGGSQAIEFTSTANSNGADHDLSVTAAVTATWLPGDYVLAGYAVNGAARHQIYSSPCTITPNLPAAGGAEPETTFAQRMVAKLEAVMEGKAGNDILESRIGETMFKYLTPTELRTEHGYWKSVRANEIQKERAKAGLPTGNKIRPLFNIQSGGMSRGFGWR